MIDSLITGPQVQCTKHREEKCVEEFREPEERPALGTRYNVN